MHAPKETFHALVEERSKSVRGQLLIGKQDNTAIGKALAPEALRKNLGVYGKLAPEAAARLPQARLVMFDDLGHAPQIRRAFIARFSKG
jgi:hypothetical protein